MADAIRVPRCPRIRLRVLNLPGLAFIVALLVVWQIVVGTHLVTYTFLPSPSAIARAGGHLLVNGSLPRDLAHTVVVALIGWVLGSLLGLILGLVLGLYRVVWRNAMSTFEVLRALPAIALVPAAVLLLGFSVKMELVIAGYVTVWPVFLNTIDGVRSVTYQHRDVAAVMRLTPRDRLRKIVLPSATGVIVVGLRLSLALSLALAVVAEMVGNPHGVGYALVLMQQALQPAGMFAYIVAIGIVGIIFNAGFLTLARLVFPGPMAAAEEATS